MVHRMVYTVVQALVCGMNMVLHWHVQASLDHAMWFPLSRLWPNSTPIRTSRGIRPIYTPPGLLPMVYTSNYDLACSPTQRLTTRNAYRWQIPVADQGHHPTLAPHKTVRVTACGLYALIRKVLRATGQASEEP